MIIREEMNAIGSAEILMPSIQPSELWQESGRWDDYGPELLRLKDRHDRQYCVGPTFEEVITDLIKKAELPERVTKRALDTFEMLAVARLFCEQTIGTRVPSHSISGKQPALLY